MPDCLFHAKFSTIFLHYRRGYVPGYTGCVLWANDSPPLSAEKEPRRESTARVHKYVFFELSNHESLLV